MGNRVKANIILASVFLIFAASTAVKILYKDNYTAGLIQFVAEAALIGGIADWFAVSALFRKPLGISWHTSIVPRNRQLIITKVAKIVSENLLATDTIKSGIKELRLSERFLELASGDSFSTLLTNQLNQYLTDQVGTTDSKAFAGGIGKHFNELLEKEDTSVGILNIIIQSVDDARYRLWISSLLTKASEKAAEPSTKMHILKLISRITEEKGTGSALARLLLKVIESGSHTNFEKIAGICQIELVDFLKKTSQPGNPLFEDIASSFASMLKDEKNKPFLLISIQSWKNGILGRTDLSSLIGELVSAAIRSDRSRNDAALLITSNLKRYSKNINNNSEAKEMVDCMIGDIAERIILNEHHLVADIVTETLESFTDEMLVTFIETRAGNSLQWIRINGSIVGAAFGLIIYIFTTKVYSPFIVPFIVNLFS